MPYSAKVEQNTFQTREKNTIHSYGQYKGDDQRPGPTNYTAIEVSLSFLYGATAPSWSGPPHYRSFTITLRHTIPGRTALDERSARHRYLYLTTQSTHKRQISMHPVRFEPAISSKRTAADPHRWNHPFERLAVADSLQPAVSYCVPGYSSAIVNMFVFQRVGCDLKIGSMKKVDGCGVCGGDGQSCAQPLYHWEEAAMSLCSVTCGGGWYRMQIQTHFSV